MSFPPDLAVPPNPPATEVATFERWSTLADPEGNEFDLIRG
jgi:hypothetical protein